MPKTGFPMPTAENGFLILNLHPKKYIFKDNNLFLMPIYQKNSIPLIAKDVKIVSFDDQ